jgi:RimJ/RimL family protein N-acetyltransferase
MTAEDVNVNSDEIHTKRLVLRAWSPDDADDALETYGNESVARWLAPLIDLVPTKQVMQDLLVQWRADSWSRRFPEGRWAIEHDGVVIGGAQLLPFGSSGRHYIGGELRPASWGHGLAAEAGHALGHQAFELDGIDEIFAVTHPQNAKGIATALRIGMTRCGTTDEVGGRKLALFGLRKTDLHAVRPGVSPSAGYNPVGLNDW